MTKDKGLRLQQQVDLALHRIEVEQLTDQGERLRLIGELMKHWGERRAQLGLEASLGSQMGSIMEWKGAAPRGGALPQHPASAVGSAQG